MTMAKMTLWRVLPCFDGMPATTSFAPRIPQNPIPGEDKTTPRVCLCDSIEHCLDAVAESDRKKILLDGQLVAYPFRVDTDDVNLLCTDDIVEKVPDAHWTKEYWYLAPVTLTGVIMQITAYSEYVEYGVDETYRPMLFQFLKAEGLYCPEMESMLVDEVFANIPSWAAEEIVQREGIVEIHRFGYLEIQKLGAA